jgi:hypothetical protein
MIFKTNDKVVFENENIPNNQVMTITKGNHKRNGFDMVRLLLNGGAGIAYANELRLATEEEKAANKRFIKVKHKIQYGIPVLSNSKAGCIYFPYTSVTIGIDLASGPDWTPPVSINGEDNA